MCNTTQQGKDLPLRHLKCTLIVTQCVINSVDPGGMCSTCQNLGRTISNLPCLRAKILESVLFRNLVDPGSGMPKFSIHFGTGVEKPVTEWNVMERRTIELTQGFKSILQLRVRKAEELNLANVTKSQHFMYRFPWALADFQETMDEVGCFIERSIKPAVSSKVSKKDKVAFHIFQVALIMANHEEKVWHFLEFK